MSGFRTPEIPREQMVLWERRLEDAIPDDHQVRHLDFLLGSAAFAETFREMEWAGSVVRDLAETRASHEEGESGYHRRHGAW